MLNRSHFVFLHPQVSPTPQNAKGFIGICVLRPACLCVMFCVLTFCVLRYFCVGSSEDAKCFLIDLMCFALLLRRVLRGRKMLLRRSSLTELRPKIGKIYLRFGSTEGTICPHFVLSADPATQFVHILRRWRTPRRTPQVKKNFAFCVRNCV